MRRLSAAVLVVTPVALTALCVAPSKPDHEEPSPIALLADLQMFPIGDGVYAESGLTSSETTELQKDYETARKGLAVAFEDDVRSSPLTFFCRSASCKVAFGADPESARASDLGFAVDAVPTQNGSLTRSAVVVTGPVGGTSRILTHELVHAEMKAWVPYDALPTWFNEGMATLLANEPNCDLHPPSSDSSDESLLVTKAAWQRHIHDHRDTLETYCQSRHRVSAWAARFGDDRQRAMALKRLMTAVSTGTPFERAYLGD